jgi:hypothetical protein
MPIIPKAIYMFNASISNSNDILHRNRKINPEIHMETRKTSITKAILNKKSNAGGVTIPNFKLYYRAITTKTTWY